MSNLMPCETCGKPTAKNAKTCPHCGAQIYRTSEFTKVIMWVLGFALLLFVVGLWRSL